MSTIDIDNQKNVQNTGFVNVVPYAYCSWEACLQKNKELRMNIGIKENKKEDEYLCSKLFRIYFADVNKIELKN